MLYNFIYFFLQPLVMSFPSLYIRILFLKLLGMRIGTNTTICRYVKVRSCPNITIGNNCIINQHTLLDGRGAELIIGDNVDVAQETNIWTMEHNIHTHEATSGNVSIGDYVWIGSRVTVLPGVTIGKDSICAACAVVSHDVPENSVVGGVPARVICQRNRTENYVLMMNSIFR